MSFSFILKRVRLEAFRIIKQVKIVYNFKVGTVYYGFSTEMNFY